MKPTQAQLTLPLECYASGELGIHPMDEAITKLCQANYGFLAPLNKLTWRMDEYKGWNSIYEVAGERPTILGLYIYIYHGQPFTIDDAEALINGRNELSKELFIAWASRFNLAFQKGPHGQALPKRLWPFRYVKTFANGNGRIMRPAYQMWDDRTSFLVMGADGDRVDTSVTPNWALFWKEFLRKWKS